MIMSIEILICENENIWIDNNLCPYGITKTLDADFKDTVFYL